MLRKPVLGIDVGGSGIKGAPVDVRSGVLLEERYRIPTPENGKPQDVAETIAQLVRHFGWNGEIGCGFPAAVRDGVALTASNIHKSWIGEYVPRLISEKTSCDVTVINDADCAGLAEMRFGAGRNKKGTVIVITVGTGLGTAIFHNGHLLPNTELGHIEIGGKNAEQFACDGTRKSKNLNWKEWALRFNEYLLTLDRLFWPALFIIGGGVSKKHEKFFQYLAELRNDAGIIGAALASYEQI